MLHRVIVPTSMSKSVTGVVRPASEDTATKSREAVEERFEAFVEAIIDEALDEFEPFRVVNAGSLPGNTRVKSVLRPLIEEELNLYRASINEQFDVVMEYAENDGPVEEYLNDFLRADVFYQNYAGDSRYELADELEQRLIDMGGDMRPLLQSGEDDFWDAVVASYDEDTAHKMLPKHFEYTDVIDDYRDDLCLQIEIGNRLVNVEVEYTDEALRCLKKSEGTLKQHLRDRVEEVYA